MAAFDPVLIPIIRRVMPSLIAHEIVGVQPMSGPWKPRIKLWLISPIKACGEL